MTARFDVVADRDGQLLLNVRANHLEGLEVVVVVPLAPLEASFPVFRDLNPILNVNHAPYRMMTQLIGAVPRSIMRRPLVDNLAAYQDEITRALDMLFTEF